MITVHDYLFNPVLTPNSKNKWENKAVFNGSIADFNQKYLMAYRAIGDEVPVDGKNIELSSIGLVRSDDLHTFSKRQQIIKPEYLWEEYGCEDPRICQYGSNYYIFYTAIGGYPPSAEFIKVALAKTTDFKTFEKHLVTPFNAKAMVLFPDKINGKITALLTVNTDLPPSRICLAVFDKIEDLWSPNYWHRWYQNLASHEINLRRLTTDHVEVGAAPIATPEGWLLIYSHIQNYYAGKEAVFGIEAILLDKNDPTRLIGRTAAPLLVPQENYELEGMVPNVIFPSSSIVHGDDLFIYYGAADTVTAMAKVNLSDLLIDLKSHIHSAPKLIRHTNNPIISPKPGSNWESKAVFNPAAVLLNNQIHLIYRAMNESNTSVFGYAKSLDGVTIIEKSETPICVPENEFDTKKVDNGFSGCEDPRATVIGNRLYVCNTAYDGVSPPKIVLTSISIKDFLDKKWNFTPPQLISDPATDNKDGCLFPELINGKYVFLHREGGKGILIDYVDNLDFKDIYLEGETCFSLGPLPWENSKMGIAAPPLKTDYGWLLLYHGVSSLDHHYRVGAMLLQLDNPHIVIGRTQYPLLEPEMDYEKVGEVNNVVFPCGAVVKDGTLFVYYGAADKVIGVAKGNLQEIILSLLPSTG